MSERMPYAQALHLAQQLVQELRPYVRRIEIAGSVRRQRESVKDIELVVQPCNVVNLFDEPVPDISPVQLAAARWGDVLKGGEKYIQVAHQAGINLDIFIVTPPADWGPILAIRTGPAELGHWAVTLLHDHGLRCRDGRIERMGSGEHVPCDDEATFFALAGLPYLPPERRDEPAAMRRLR